MSNEADINNAGGIILVERKVLMVKPKGKSFFIAPGGGIELGETPEEALVRELNEELGIKVLEGDLEKFGEFFANAIGQEEKLLKMNTFIVKKWLGEITPVVDNELEDLIWMNSKIPEGITIGSIFNHNVIPKLKELNLID